MFQIIWCTRCIQKQGVKMFTELSIPICCCGSGMGYKLLLLKVRCVNREQERKYNNNLRDMCKKCLFLDIKTIKTLSSGLLFKPQ